MIEDELMNFAKHAAVRVDVFKRETALRKNE